MTLGEQQRLFVKLVGQLITHAYMSSYEFTFGEAYRTSEQALLNERKGTGIRNSVHCSRLAIDLNLFLLEGAEWKWQTESVAYKPLGDFWKTLHPLCRWGGDFRKQDGNHFSMEFEGRA